MADQFKARTLKRKNVKGLALNAAPKPSSNTDSDGQASGAVGSGEVKQTDTLEIGLEFRLDLRSEDLVTLKELGAGNGGTVSKVMHASTKVVMARKVCARSIRRPSLVFSLLTHERRSFESMPRRRCASKYCGNCKSDMTVIPRTSLLSTEPSRTKPEISSCVWNTWIAGKWALERYSYQD